MKDSLHEAMETYAFTIAALLLLTGASTCRRVPYTDRTEQNADDQRIHKADSGKQAWDEF